MSELILEQQLVVAREVLKVVTVAMVSAMYIILSSRLRCQCTHSHMPSTPRSTKLCTPSDHHFLASDALRSTQLPLLRWTLEDGIEEKPIAIPHPFVSWMRE